MTALYWQPRELNLKVVGSFVTENKTWTVDYDDDDDDFDKSVGSTANEVVTASDILKNLRPTLPPFTTTTTRPVPAGRATPAPQVPPPTSGPVSIGSNSVDNQPPGVVELHKLHRRPFYWGGGGDASSSATSSAIEQHNFNRKMIRGHVSQNQVDQLARIQSTYDHQQWSSSGARTRATKEAPKSNYIDFRYGEKLNDGAKQCDGRMATDNVCDLLRRELTRCCVWK